MSRFRQTIVLATLSISFALPAFALAIPSAEIDSVVIFRGNPASFENPAEVDYEAVRRATPEFREIEDDDIEEGTARYWVLLSKATDRTVKAISKAGRENGYDLVARKGYLGGLSTPIGSTDITGLALDLVK